MAFEIIIKPIVFLDLDEAINWYESEQEGLAARFYKSFETAIERIKEILMHLLMLLRGLKEYF